MDRNEAAGDHGRPDTGGDHDRSGAVNGRPPVSGGVPSPAGADFPRGPSDAARSAGDRTTGDRAGSDPPGASGVGGHIPEGVLAAIALDGSAGPSTTTAREHLEGCARCRTELTDLREIVSAVRGAGPADAAVAAPPPGLWDAIAAEVKADARA
ncbi:hypothetical protein FNQ90_22210, partial [Streptomyces alkaliphilus]|nr:hypothetical protein [Streptomyces alkaliphilus]